LQGEARKEFVALREDIVGCLAIVEALIDFGDEEIEEGVFEEGTCVAHTCLSPFWDVGLFEHSLMTYVRRGHEHDV